MKIQYASDLHLEFAENWRYLREHPLEKAGDILVLAGDIGYIGDENYSLHPFWSQVADQYEQVIVVPGNHEFYKYYDISSLQEGELVQIRSNVKVYYNAIVNMGDVDMILSTLWAHIPLQDAFATESGVTDFHRIMFDGETLTFEQFNKEHERCMDFLCRACKSTSASKRVIMSLRSSCHPRISKEAVSTVPLFQMKMTSLRLVVLTIGFTATLTGTLIGRLGRHYVYLIN